MRLESSTAVLKNQTSIIIKAKSVQVYIFTPSCHNYFGFGMEIDYTLIYKNTALYPEKKPQFYNLYYSFFDFFLYLSTPVPSKLYSECMRVNISNYFIKVSPGPKN